MSPATQRLIRIEFLVNNELVVIAIYDTGSNISLINRRALDKLLASFESRKVQSPLRSVVGEFHSGERAILTVKIGSRTEKQEFYIVDDPKFKYDAIVGLDAIKKFGLSQTEDLRILQKAEKKKFNILRDASKETDLIEINLIEHKPSDDELKQSLLDLKFDIEDKDQRKMVLDLLMENKQLFTMNKFNIRQYSKTQAEVKLIEEKIINLRPYKTSLSDEREIESQIRQLLENDLIEETDSPYASPVTLANKKGEGKSRMCVDMRALNKLVVPETHPLQRFEDILDKLQGCGYLTTVDINSAFWTVKLKRKSRKYTAFVTNRYHFQWKVLPFGLKSSPAIFQRILASILRRAGCSDFAVNYIDDVLIFSRTFEEHLEHVRRVLKALEEASMNLKLSKCQFFKSEVTYLGHRIGKNFSQPMNDNLRAIREFPRPKNRKNVRQILGKVNHYRKYIASCTQKLRPLHDLLKKNVRFKWTEQCEAAFENIKSYLSQKPILATFNENAESFIFTDASAEGCAAILKQRQTNGELKPVAYFSCKISKAQFKRGAIYVECLAIYNAIRFWHYYLHNTTFTVFSDHKPLENLRVTAAPDTPLGDLVNKLLQYNFTIRHLAGAKNLEADCLSRNPILTEFDDEEIFATANLIELEEIIEVHDRVSDEEAHLNDLIRLENVLFKKKNGKLRIYLNKKLAKKVIELAHEQFGHIGATKMKEKLRQKFYFRKLDKLIDQFCESCATCLKNKSRQKRPIGMMSELGPSDKPLKIISIDSVGGLTGRGAKKNVLHLAIDHCTRFVWHRASRTQTADDFIKLIESIGDPKEIEIILMDQYSALDSKKLREFAKANDIAIIHSPVDHAESNGRVERVNQTVINSLRCKHNEPGESRCWSSLIGEVVKRYNNTMHSVTKFPPVLLLTGKVDYPVSPIIEDIDLKEALREANENSKEHHLANKKLVDRKRREYEFVVGDVVNVKLTSKLNRAKLAEIRPGPFKIVKAISSSVFELNTGRRKKVNNLYHRNDLFPVVERTEFPVASEADFEGGL